MNRISKARKWLARLIAFAATWGLWLALANDVSPAEVLCGLGAALISSIAVGAYVLHGKIEFRFRARDVIQVWRFPWCALQGTWQVVHSLGLQLFVRDAPSFHGAVAYRTVDTEDPFSAGRRALAVTFTTMTPNFIVLGIVLEQRLLLYHQILPGEVLQMTTNLGADP